MSRTEPAARRLKALIEADPGALIRLLQLLQIRNIVPLSVRARRLGCEYLEAEIELDDTEITTDTLRLIAAKAQELPITLAAVVLQPETDAAIRSYAAVT